MEIKMNDDRSQYFMQIGINDDDVDGPNDNHRYSSPPKALRTLFSGFLGRLPFDAFEVFQFSTFLFYSFYENKFHVLYQVAFSASEAIITRCLKQINSLSQRWTKTDENLINACVSGTYHRC